MLTDAETIANLEAKIATLQKTCDTLQHDLQQQQQETINVLEESWWLHTVFERASTGLVTATLDGRITRYNPAFQHMLGYSRSEMINLSFDAFTHPDDLQTEIPLVQEMLAGNQETVTLEKRFIRKNGTILWVRVQLSVGYDSEKNPQALIGIIEDITEQRQTTQSLHESEEQYRTIIEHMRDGVFLLANARLIFANYSFAHMLGYTQAEILKLGFADVVAPEDLPMIVERNRQRVSGEDVPDQYEFRMLHQDSSRVVVSIVVSSLYYKGKTVVMGTTRDVTRQKQMEAEQRIFQTLVENSPDGITVTETDGAIRYANPAYQHMAGYGEELIGMPVADLYSMQEATDRSTHLDELLTQGTWQGRATFLRKDGVTLPVQESVFVVPDEHGQPQALAAIVRDISAHMQQEQERIRLQQQVIEAQQTAIRELSTPLIPLTRHTVLMPLVGSIDSNRAQMIMETLLEGIAAHQAEQAIIDITGVSVVDTQVAHALVQTASAAQLLGAKVLLTGIGPTMAQTLIHLGVDLGSFATRGSLQRAIQDTLYQNLQNNRNF
jgi:rsbT co-antagonist protein RsbR